VPVIVSVVVPLALGMTTLGGMRLVMVGLAQPPPPPPLQVELLELPL